VFSSICISLLDPKDVAAEASTKVWGAAELDAAMYMCGATGKLFNTPLFCPPKTKVEIAPPRSLDPALSDTLAKLPGKLLTEKFGVSAEAYAAARSASFANLEREFQKRARFVSGDTAGQFGFDFTAYLEWRLAAQFLPQTEDRKRFLAAVGAGSLAALRGAGADAASYDARAEVPARRAPRRTPPRPPRSRPPIRRAADPARHAKDESGPRAADPRRAAAPPIRRLVLAPQPLPCAPPIADTPAARVSGARGRRSAALTSAPRGPQGLDKALASCQVRPR
jgi:hypothetical protein